MGQREREIEAERARLREEAAELSARCGTDKPPTWEEMHEFGERVAEFGSKVRPPGSSLYGILSD